MGARVTARHANVPSRDDLAPARGCLVAFALVAPFWLAAGGFVWAAYRILT